MTNTNVNYMCYASAYAYTHFYSMKSNMEICILYYENFIE